MTERAGRMDPIERQRSYLEGLHKVQETALEASGTAQKGRDVLLEREAYMKGASGLTDAVAEPSAQFKDKIERSSVAVSEIRGKLRLVFTGQEALRSGISDVRRYVDVAHRIGDVSDPIGRFDDADVRLAAGFVDEVKEARASGKLPDVSDDLAQIIDSRGESAFT